MTEEQRQAWARMVEERTGGSERHRAAAEAILENTLVPDEHVAAADELVGLNLSFPRNQNGTYAANFHPDFHA
jgi:hypothetical protein